MFGSVVLEHTADFRHSRDRPHVREQDHHLEGAVDRVEERALHGDREETLGSEHRRNRVRERDEEKESHHESEDHRTDDLGPRKLFRRLGLSAVRPGVLGGFAFPSDLGRERKGAHALDHRLDERHDSAKNRFREDRIAAEDRRIRVVLDHDLLRVLAADRDRDEVRRTHHHALEDGLAADARELLSRWRLTRDDAHNTAEAPAERRGPRLPF